MPSDLIALLRSFHSKERQILLSEALCREEGGEAFSLDAGFRERLRGEIGVAVPADAYVAMDYHLDWLAMALYLAATPDPPERIPNDNGELFEGNQQDIDLLVAFEAADGAHLALIEAKGVTRWDKQQLASKALRLRGIFDDGSGSSLATPHFVLMSPKRPGIEASDWPGWMKRPGGEPYWLELPLPGGLHKATRCDADGNDARVGRFVRLDPLGRRPPRRRP